MPVLALAGSEQKRQAGALPGLVARNIYMEPDPTNTVDGMVRLQRPGLSPWVNVGDGPINSVFRLSGLFGGDYFVHSGTQLWRVNSAGIVTFVGGLANSRAQMAASANKLIAVNGSFARSFDGTTWRVINMPDGQPVQSVAFLAGFFVFTVLGSQRVYYMEPGESDPDPLSFFEAERLPDPLVTAAVSGDELWLIGEQSEEVWVPSGDPDAPFDRVGGRAYENGCLARDTLVQVDNALIWVSRDANVILAQGQPRIISKPDIAEWLRNSPPATMRAWAFKLDQHLFILLTAGSETWCFDISTERWFRWSSYNSDAFRAHLGVDLVAGDAETNQLYRLTPGRSNDNGEPMVREIAGMIEVVGAPVRCDSVSLRAAVGNTTELRQPTGCTATGFWDDGAEWDDYDIWYDETPLLRLPRIELRWSDDEGNLWTDWRSVTLGLQGQYRRPVVWRKLGLLRRSLRIFQFRATDDVEFRISHAHWNEAVN